MNKYNIFRSLLQIAILLFTLTGVLYAEERVSLRELRERIVPSGSEYNEERNQQIKNMMKLADMEEDGKTMSGRKMAEIYYFDIDADYETAKQEMVTKGILFKEWDKERLKRQQRMKIEANRKQEKKKGEEVAIKYYKPFEMPDYKRATASKWGAMFILSTHFLDLETGQWKEGTNLQVIQLNAEST